ncbi:MAG TPA: hypothetical protein VGI76_01835 [Solirubrobacteraceae bacterium]
MLVGQAIRGLAPGAVYHYRLVAVNAEGTSEGPDKTLKTFTPESTTSDTCVNADVRGRQFSSYLPDCRAYEMVSPTDKEGGNIAADPGATQSTPDGEAIKYDSLTAFGDAAGIQTQGAEYISRRAADGSGWTTHGINPEQNSQVSSTVFVTSQYLGFSEDLSKGVYFGISPVLAGHPNVEKTANLYLRTDMLAPPGSYELLSDAVSELPARGWSSQIREMGFAGASADWKHVIFESVNDLTASSSSLSTSVPKLYEWHDGVVSLVGVLPDGEPAAASVAGDGAGGGPGEYENLEEGRNAISSDGSRVIFEGAPLSPEGVSGASGTSGNLYMRIDGTETVQLNVSERSEPDPRGPLPATFAAANADDSEVLFMTVEALTDDAPTGGGLLLYKYDGNAPQGKRITLISRDEEPALGGEGDRAFSVVGASRDFKYIYFVGNDRLIAGQAANPESAFSSGASELYVWHEGTIRLIVARAWRSIFIADGEAGWGEMGFTPAGFVGYAYGFRVTPDGMRVAFESVSRDAAQRAGYDDAAVGPGHEDEFSAYRGCRLVTYPDIGNTCRQVYTYDYASNKLGCASCDPTGAGPETNAGFEDSADTYSFGENTWYQPRAMTSDGRYIFFDSSEPLVPEDTNGKRDVYEYDTSTGSVHLISSGTCNCGSHFVDASANGNDVFFVTAQRLVQADRDAAGDLYDARVDGGIPSQNVAPPSPCEGDDCQGPAKVAPSFSLPASAAFAGGGNAEPSKPSTKVTTRSLTRSQKLARALRACRKRHGARRAACEVLSRKRYGAKRSAARNSRRVGR